MAVIDYRAFGLKKLEWITSDEYRGGVAQLIAAGLATAQEILAVSEIGRAFAHFDARGNMVPMGVEAEVRRTIYRARGRFSVQVHFDRDELRVLAKTLKAEREAREDHKFQAWLLNLQTTA